MPIRLKPYLMIIILLLNQWFAASAMASHTHTMPILDMAECNMAQHGMDISGTASHLPEQENHNMDCCDQDCSCSASACSSAALINLDVAKLNINSSFALFSYQFSSLTVSLSLFQKPPQRV